MHADETGSQLSPFRPIHIMYEEGLEPDHLKAVLDATHAVLSAAGVTANVEVNNFGVWRNSGWLVGNTLTNWNSIDWYLAHAQRASRNDHQLHGGHLLKLLYNEPWQKARPHYDIVVTHSDLYDDDCRFCIGLAVHGLGTVISTNRFLKLDARAQRECIITETMHEVGHVFGLIPEDRTDNVEMSLGLHCTNKCIMRQGLSVPHDWIKITDDRLAGHEFCNACLRDLHRYFYQD
jgi:predicted Zn-dependent protease